MKKLPSYRLHKATNQAICWISGRTYYLGDFDSPESREAFNKLVAQYLTDPNFGIDKNSLSMAEAVVAYLKHADVYYRSGSAYVGMKDACKPLVELYADLHVSNFGIVPFKACREFWVKRGCSRQYVNKQSKRLLRFVKWLVAEGFAEPSLHHGLKCVEPLKRGRCPCPESDPVRPIDDKAVSLTLPHLPPILRDMVRRRKGVRYLFSPMRLSTSNRAIISRYASQASINWHIASMQTQHQRFKDNATIHGAAPSECQYI